MQNIHKTNLRWKTVNVNNQPKNRKYRRGLRKLLIVYTSIGKLIGKHQ